MLSLFHVFLEFQLTNIIFSIYANFFYTMPSCLVLFTITMAHFLQRRGDLGAHRKRRNFLKVRIFHYIFSTIWDIGLIRLVHISWVFYQILNLSIVKLSIQRNTQLLALTLLNKSWVFLQILNLTILKLSIWKILNLSGPGGQVLWCMEYVSES